MKLVVATGNIGKIKELNELLIDLPVKLYGLNDFTNISDVEETGLTFADNAVLKAESYAVQTGFWTLSDDSGLEVEALGGAPGIFSARYAGENASDQDRITKLLEELNRTNDKVRAARFICAMAIADKNGQKRFLAEGICNGKIVLQPHGTNGFGYDPIFVPNGFEQTFGELSSTIKGKISHRARAIAKIIRFLHTFTKNELDQ
jgi:XTP/dITP diphosphohydrolase